MPGLDRLALIRGARGRRKGMPAILLTGFVNRAAELAVSGRRGRQRRGKQIEPDDLGPLVS